MSLVILGRFVLNQRSQLLSNFLIRQVILVLASLVNDFSSIEAPVSDDTVNWASPMLFSAILLQTAIIPELVENDHNSP
jgi:hypothetical protein